MFMQSAMVDYILGVLDPLQWHSQITQVADEIGGVHFNPFVTWNDKVLTFQKLKSDDLNTRTICVHIPMDNLDVANSNSVNLRAALFAALPLLPSKFTQEDLFAKICSLSYMGDLRMHFAEDKNRVQLDHAYIKY
ncbi:hypothetical protein Patl1_12109 [Pistacia atlantica]|uniref:Uncharacterized protein n=1 Tax=Pistacia atlantica TaxID=434234 RepID=A0ACC1AA72_9ROSI|nr:hypothetical protein Patl1_12109 [Pistacia atlantica]